MWSQSSIVEGVVSCWVQGLHLQSFQYIFKAQSVGSAGPGEFSLESQVLNWTPAQARAIRPRALDIVRAERRWCELVWEQTVDKSAPPPTTFRLQEIREGWEEWRSLGRAFCCPEDDAEQKGETESDAEDETTTRRMRCVVFFENDPPRQRWRLRACCEPAHFLKNANEGACDWSTPCAWQDPKGMEVLSRPSMPQVAKVDTELCHVSWKASGGKAGRFEVQAQAHRSWKGFSEWSKTQSFTAAPSGDGEIKALVDIEPSGLASILEEPGAALRFRVRQISDAGMGPFSEPSALSKPGAAAGIQGPAPPIVLEQLAYEPIGGLGKWASEIVPMSKFEMVKLQWPLSDEAQKTITGFVVEYEDDVGDWSPNHDAHICIDWSKKEASAIVPLHTMVEEKRHSTQRRSAQTAQAMSARYRIAAVTPRGMTAFSQPCSTVYWGGAPMPPMDIPTIVLLSTERCVLHFTPPSEALATINYVMVVLDLAEEERDDDEVASDDEDDPPPESMGEFAAYVRRLAEGALEAVVSFDASNAPKVGTWMTARVRCVGGVGAGPSSMPTMPQQVTDWDDERRGGMPAALLLEYSEWSPLIPLNAPVAFSPYVFMHDPRTGNTLEWTSETGPSLRYTVERGILPAGLELDEETGVISGLVDEFDNFDSFIIACRIDSSWLSDAGGGQVEVRSGTIGTVLLGCALVEEALCELFSDDCLESLHDNSECIYAVVDAVQNRVIQDLLTAIVENEMTVETIGVIVRLTELPDLLESLMDLSDDQLQKRLEARNSHLGDLKLEQLQGALEGGLPSSPYRSPSSTSSSHSGSLLASSGDPLKRGSEKRGTMSLRGSLDGLSIKEEEALIQQNLGNSKPMTPRPIPGGSVRRSTVSFGDRSMGGMNGNAQELSAALLAKANTSGLGRSPQSGRKSQQLRNSLGGSGELAKADDRSTSRRMTDQTMSAGRRQSRIAAMPSGPLSQELASKFNSSPGRTSQGQGGPLSAQDVSEALANALNASIPDQLSPLKSDSSSADKDHPDQSTLAKTPGRRGPRGSIMQRGGGGVHRDPGQRGSKDNLSANLLGIASRGNVSNPVTDVVKEEIRMKRFATVTPYEAGAGKREASRRPSDLVVKNVKVIITYQGLSPFWAAFQDLQFSPKVVLFDEDKNMESEDPLPTGLKYEVSPALPAAVRFDTTTGTISGSPILPYVPGAQYTVVVKWGEEGQPGQALAYASFACAVLPSELAQMCNNAFLATEPPAFREFVVSPVDSQSSPREEPNLDGPLESLPAQSPFQVLKSLRPLGYSLKERVSPTLPSTSKPATTPRRRTPLSSTEASMTCSPPPLRAVATPGPDRPASVPCRSHWSEPSARPMSVAGMVDRNPAACRSPWQAWGHRDPCRWQPLWGRPEKVRVEVEV